LLLACRFNSWDRVPYVTDDPVSGKQVVGPRLSTITRNLIIANYKTTWPIDHDDGSNHYLDSYNALWYGGAKNYLGHSKHSINNLYAFVDAQPYEGTGPGKHFGGCAVNDGAEKDSSGWGEVYASNRCHLTTPTAPAYSWGNCAIDDLNATVDWTFNNTFYTPNGRIAVHCNKKTSWTLAQYQQRGYDLKSTEVVSPPLETLIEWSRELIAL
jgi:hypothetical protein